jgi:cell division protein ZapD
MNQAIFEFPLNEKVRNYLRVEYMFNIIADPELCCTKNNEVTFLRNLFQLLDLNERVDMKTELIRDLNVYAQNIKHWLSYSNVDKGKLNATAEKVNQTIEALSASPRIGCSLRQDRFLSAIRQRFSIPGATCSFDLPKLHYWINQPSELKCKQMQDWLAPMLLLERAIRLVLTFIRQRKPLESVTAANGFYQGVADAKVELIRIEYSHTLDYYPTLSGNKYRYAVRFMRFGDDNLSEKDNNKDISFKLASC